jgi:hypothetical protein
MLQNYIRLEKIPTNWSIIVKLGGA